MAWLFHFIAALAVILIVASTLVFIVQYLVGLVVKSRWIRVPVAILIVIGIAVILLAGIS